MEICWFFLVDTREACVILRVVPARLGLEAPALAWPEWALAFSTLRPSQSHWERLGSGLARLQAAAFQSRQQGLAPAYPRPHPSTLTHVLLLAYDPQRIACKHCTTANRALRPQQGDCRTTLDADRVFQLSRGVVSLPHAHDAPMPVCQCVPRACTFVGMAQHAVLNLERN